MEQLTYIYQASEVLAARAHVGVVASGDLEVLLEPLAGEQARVIVTTSVEGFGAVWQHVLDRFFSRFHGAALIEINDFGATPGLVALRLAQAVEALQP
jgi:malonate decarboxylase acyl carrier protein